MKESITLFGQVPVGHDDTRSCPHRVMEEYPLTFTPYAQQVFFGIYVVDP